MSERNDESDSLNPYGAIKALIRQAIENHDLQLVWPLIAAEIARAEKAAMLESYEDVLHLLKPSDYHVYPYVVGVLKELKADE